MEKATSKSCTLDCSYNALSRSRIVTHSNAASFLIKTILCENTNSLFFLNVKLERIFTRCTRIFTRCTVKIPNVSNFFI